MLKDTTPKPLAQTPEEWTQARQLIEQHVERIAFKYDDREQAESLVLLIDMLTNEDYLASDRESAAMIAKHHAFRYTEAFETAMNICLMKVDPAQVELRMA